jgi:DNA polymerase-3 subunit delta'
MSIDFIGQPLVRAMLDRSVAEGRVRHAYLLLGPARIGKTSVARWFAARLVCPNQPAPCGTCRTCQRIAQGIHPDVRAIQPPGDRSEAIGLPLEALDPSGRGAEQTVGIAQIRALKHDAALSSNEAPWKVYFVLGAETMQIAAANSLLKTLEEPQPRVVLVLTARDSFDLLPTLVSRCQVIRLGLVPAPEIAEALEQRYGCDPVRADLLARLSGGRPGWAVQALTDPDLEGERARSLAELAQAASPTFRERFALAEALASGYSRDHSAVLDRLAVWQVWWWDVHLVQRGCDELVTNTDQLGTLRDCARRVSPEQVRAYVNDLAAGSLQLTQNVNPRLALESLVLASPGIR